MSTNPEKRPRATAKKGGKGKKVVALVVVAALVVAGGAGGYAYYLGRNSSPVNVYSLSDIAMDSYWGDQSESDGMISTDDLQVIYLSDTQELSEILVTEGQEVKEGDPLFTYDSTLTQLDIDRADLSIQLQELDLEDAKKELVTIKTYRAGVPIPGSSHYYPPASSGSTSSNEPEVVEYDITPASGKGTENSPYLYSWADVVELNGGVFDSYTLSQLSQGNNDAYVTIQMPAGVSPQLPEEPAESETPSESEEPSEPWSPAESETPEEPTESEPAESEPAETEPEESPAATSEEPEETEEPTDAPIEEPAEETPVASATNGSVAYSTLSLQIQCVDDSYSYVVLSMSVNGAQVTLSDPLPAPEEEEEEEPEEDIDTGYYDPGITYTAAELAQMIADQEQTVRGLELDIRQSKLEYEKLKQEAENNTVYAELDGTVTMVAEDPENLDLIDPMMEVSAGGCYTVTAVLGEFDLDGVSVGQTVDVNVYGNSYTSCQGVITWISEYPTSDGDSNFYYYSGGNSNISTYPFTVQIDEGENLNEGDYAEIYYSSEGEDTSGIYLQNEFIRSENGKSYVYVEVDGKLEKRYVSTGMSLWGSYTEIRSGLTMEDYVAFPYGTNVKDGAVAVEADISELYSSAGYY
jgi:hypothetical protein